MILKVIARRRNHLDTKLRVLFRSLKSFTLAAEQGIPTMIRPLWLRVWIQIPVLCVAASLLLGGTAAAQPALNLQLVASGFASPVGIVNAHDGSNRLFIVEQGGDIKIYDGTQVLATPFLNIASKVLSGGERGLLGLAFDSSYLSNGFFYVYYTSQPAGQVTIARYSVTADPNVGDPNSEHILKTQDHSQFANHNGGSLLFGPDGCLYAGIGDGGSGGDPNGNGQNLNTLLAKIIRISPIDGAACTAAPGNPFVGMPNTRDEIWALGVRNPWRITFDRQTGDLLIADVGQDTEEEVDFQPAGVGGRNYCWRHKEGTLIFDANTACTAGTPTDPVLEYDHSAGKCAITGGYRYRGSSIPEIVGTYFYGDYCTGQIWGAAESGGVWTASQLLDTTFNISTFGEDENGEIYVANISGGTFYRLMRTHSTHDFGGDGRSDIVWRNGSTGAAVGWLMNGGQVTQSATIYTVTNNWQIVGQRDFNGDGKADLLWRDTNTGTVVLWLMNGLQVTQAVTIGKAASNWVLAGVSDFNGDGKADILWRDTNTGTVAIWLMNGGTVTQSGNVGSMASNWIVAGTDSHGQIVWRNSTNGTVVIWAMNGFVISHSYTLGGAASTWVIAGVGDFDGDGSTDLLWRNSSTGAVAIWFVTNGVVTSSAGPGTMAAAWSIDLTGDFDGDGKSDIVWTNTSGARMIWFMNGGTVASSASLGTTATIWNIQSMSAE
jgi:glucose/arabinose dehydrogenase